MSNLRFACRMLLKSPGFVTVAALALALCAPALPNLQPASDTTAEPAPPAWEWPVSTPEQQGLDAKRLAELAGLIRAGERYRRLHCLLVIRHGHLVLEEYFNDWQADRIHTLQSVSKSFTSALVGMAIAKGEFKGVDEKILAFFPDVKGITNLDERKAALRLEDLLTMRSGADYHERGPDSPHYQLNRLARGWDKFYLNRPMLRPPGTHSSTTAAA